MISLGKFSFTALAAEFVGMAMFIWASTSTAVGIAPSTAEIIGGTATFSKTAAILSTSAVFGTTITALAYALGPRSGANFNPAVSLGLVLSGNLGAIQGAANFVAQTAGAILASSVVKMQYPDSSLGANSLAAADGQNLGAPFLAEALGTFALVFVVLECCCNKTRTPIDTAPIAIGMTVFIAHLALIPYTSCSINPSRSIGPALISGTWPKHFWIFIFGPFTGAATAAGTHILFERAVRPRAITHTSVV